MTMERVRIDQIDQIDPSDQRAREIDMRKPRFFGNEIFGDGECPRVYLGDSWMDVSHAIINAGYSYGDPDEHIEEMRIWVELRTDAEIEALPEL